MTHMWTRAAALAVIAAALTACQTTPTYPTHEGYTPPPPAEPPHPAYPTTRSGAQSGVSAPATSSDDAPAAAAAPRGAVESSQLPPAGPQAAEASGPPTSAEAADTPPDPSPAPETLPPAPMARYEPPPAPPAYEPPPRPRPVPTRLVATGRLITVDGGFRTYTVKAGDHVDALAREYDTTRRQIVQDNDLAEPYRLHPGDHLRLPAPPRTAYVAVGGDTLAAVARRFSVRVEALRSINNLNSRAALHGGQRLTLPGGTRDIGPQRIAAPDLMTAQAPRPPRPRPTPQPSAVASYTPPAPAYDSPPPSSLAGPSPMTMARNDLPPPATPQSAIPAASPPALIPYTRPTPPSYTRAAAPPGLISPPAPTPTALARPTPPPAPAYSPPAYTPRPYTPAPSALSAAPAVRGAPPSVPSTAPPADAQIASMGRGRFLWPVTGSILSTFGPKAGGRRNDGVDIQGADGASVRAAAAGEVVYAGDQVPGFGNLVLLKHADGWVTAYAHLGRVNVAMRQRVTQGQEIGTVGSSGGVTEPQLHFEVRYAPTPADRARPIDPALVLPAGR